MSHVTRNAKRGSLGEFRTFRDREGRARQECDSFRTFGWTKVIIFLFPEVHYCTVQHYDTCTTLYTYVYTCTAVHGTSGSIFESTFEGTFVLSYESTFVRKYKVPSKVARATRTRVRVRVVVYEGTSEGN